MNYCKLKKGLSVIFLTAVLIGLYAFSKKEPATLYIIGDSTAANKTAKTYPETGWGMKLQELFNEQEVIVDNRALNGRSTASFKHDYNTKSHTVVNHWRLVLEKIKPGDYVFIEFGHNDEKIHKPTVGTSLEKFKANLTEYVEETRQKGAIPVLLTPIERRNWINGKLVETHGGYPDATRAVAKQLNVPLIDMQIKTNSLLSRLGEEGSVSLFNHLPPGHENYPKGIQDNTHLSPKGAEQLAKLVVDGIRELNLTLATALR
ncbi:rhamnogalacturonan acetylesterase [Sphingobacterium spiritivorum]|uniref:rhamnogalacturonan acetylesterase n=1 Tax=Sphingobacterium spiritivorum TaxID=258 RepID=UPI001917BB36|nr:rhamnogalacturonan acetylesterase [Sphingobacterium spiritivorum]QQT26970.1 rhamnogalacturonan acetylesterase [Sphingobacterium spiritivorum]